MHLKNIKLSYYRNYGKTYLEFSPQINIFLGENAQGKTNLMESIHVLALSKSHRTIHDKDLIQWQQEFSKIEGILIKNNQSIPLNLVIHHNGKKASIGKIEQKRLSDYIGQLLVVIFAPEDLNIIKGSPIIRRRFLDMQIGQTNRLYLLHLMTYQKILKQRNYYLKQTTIDTNYLDILTDQLIQESAILLLYRLHYLKSLQFYAQKINKMISQNKDTFSIEYVTQFQLIEDESIESIIKKYQNYAKKIQSKEIEKRSTQFGIHRDDLLFLINGKNAQDFGSQGQQRTVALSVKLAEIDVIFEKTGDYPILLLDDVLSELDDTRQTYLLKSVENKVQTFMTTTSLDGIQKNLIQSPKIFYIKEGSVALDD